MVWSAGNQEGGSKLMVMSRIPYLSFLLLFFGCASYHQVNQDFHQEFQNGDLNEALEILGDHDKVSSGRNRFLFYADKGLLLSILGRYDESNDFFEKAFLYGEDYQKNYLAEAATYLTNPNLKAYGGEDHEHLFVLYYKALNFLKQGKPEDALVECRRLNIRLQQLNDKYTTENKFQRDAFIHTLMGIIYQSTKDYNNAFIAYRNAVEVYEEDYHAMFGIDVPTQLKIDLLNTASWIGFDDEFRFFKEKFSMEEYEAPLPGSSLVFFWHNGLVPVKGEWSINFIIEHRPDNWIVFTNRELGLSFPFQVDGDNDRRNLANLEVFRIAFPRYLERPLFYQRGTLEVGQDQYPLELLEDVNKVAFYSLNQRMMLEFGKGLLRAALKKTTEHTIRKEDERLGALVGLINAVTEKADTRNWQTLPHSILYSRVPLGDQQTTVQFKLNSGIGNPALFTFEYAPKSGETLFHTFSSLEAGYPRY